MNRRKFLGGAIAMAAAASAGLHKLGLGRVVTENAAEEAREAHKQKVDALRDGAASMAAAAKETAECIRSLGVTLSIPIRYWREQDWLPEHPQCRSWYGPHDA